MPNPNTDTTVHVHLPPGQGGNVHVHVHQGPDQTQVILDAITAAENAVIAAIKDNASQSTIDKLGAIKTDLDNSFQAPTPKE